MNSFSQTLKQVISIGENRFYFSDINFVFKFLKIHLLRLLIKSLLFGTWMFAEKLILFSSSIIWWVGWKIVHVIQQNEKVFCGEFFREQNLKGVPIILYHLVPQSLILRLNMVLVNHVFIHRKVKI